MPMNPQLPPPAPRTRAQQVLQVAAVKHRKSLIALASGALYAAAFFLVAGTDLRLGAAMAVAFYTGAVVMSLMGK